MRAVRLANAAIFPRGYSFDATMLKAKKVLTHIEFPILFCLLKKFRIFTRCIETFHTEVHIKIVETHWEFVARFTSKF